MELSHLTRIKKNLIFFQGSKHVPPVRQVQCQVQPHWRVQAQGGVPQDWQLHLWKVLWKTHQGKATFINDVTQFCQFFDPLPPLILAYNWNPGTYNRDLNTGSWSGISMGQYVSHDLNTTRLLVLLGCICRATYAWSTYLDLNYGHVCPSSSIQVMALAWNPTSKSLVFKYFQYSGSSYYWYVHLDGSLKTDLWFMLYQTTPRLTLTKWTVPACISVDTKDR